MVRLLRREWDEARSTDRELTRATPGQGGGGAGGWDSGPRRRNLRTGATGAAGITAQPNGPPQPAAARVPLTRHRGGPVSSA